MPSRMAANYYNNRMLQALIKRVKNIDCKLLQLKNITTIVQF